MILYKKAVRAMLENKKSYIACVILCGIGIMIFVCMSISTSALGTAKDNYYAQCRLADVFAKVVSIPKESVYKLRYIDGIKDVMARQIIDTRVVMPDSDKIIILRLISVDGDLYNPLNKFLYKGGGFNDYNDIMAGNGFLKAHNLETGGSVTLIINGQERIFNVCASAQSPEYIYSVKEGETLPDPETFDIAFIQEKTLWGLTNTPGTYNDVCFVLEKGYNFIDVRSALEDELARYGLVSMIDRNDQVSYAMMDAKVEANRQISLTIPFIFLFISIVVLALMLKRVIEQDRMQIGTLKAFGYSNKAILAHYIVYGGITGLFGGISGCIGGYYLSGGLNAINAGMYNLPNFVRAGVTGTLISGIIIAVASGLTGAFTGAISVLKLKPADAMRPAAPAAGKNRISRLNFISKLILNSRGNMAVRSIARNKLRSSFIVMGIMFSFGILSLVGSYISLVDEMLMTQFTKIQLYDGKVSFTQPVRYTDGVESVRSLSGVGTAEGLLEIPIEVKHKHLKRNTIITGLEQKSTLYKIHDDKRNIDLPPSASGIILSDRLAEKLDAKRGDIVYISSRLLKNDIPLIVSEVSEMNMGQNCYMAIEALSDIFNLNLSVTSVIFSASDLSIIKSSLITAPNVLTFQDRDTIMEHNKSLMGPVSMILIIVEIMGVAVAFAIIYNISSISLSERKREFTTLRVLGLTVKEVGEVLSFENWLLCFIGMILGVPFAKFMAAIYAGMINFDLMKFPAGIPSYAYILGLTGCMAAVFLSNKTSVQSIRNFEMVEVLKDRE